MSRTKLIRRAALLAALAGSFAATSTASAGHPAACLPWRFFAKTTPATSPACGCPDDYCPKPVPIPRNACGTACNDYCPKPQPTVCPDERGCCDSYRPKPWQPLSWCPPGVYRCVPGGCPTK